MKPEIYIISLGCPRNLVDAEILTGLLKEKGFKIADNYKKNCIAIVNTCGFVEDAKRESIDMIMELAELKKKNKIGHLIVTGCLSQRYSKNLLKEIPPLDGLFGSSTFNEIPAYIGRIVNGEKPVVIKRNPQFLYDHSMSRSVLTADHYVYVKIQEGCMNFCSYCAIPKIRGPYRSREIGSLAEEITSFRNRNVKEINLIGQDTTMYGADRYGKPMLAPLLKRAAKIMKLRWVRLLYTHPAHYDDNLIEVIKNEQAICKYLDLPIQHISDKILKRMNRRITKKGIMALIEKLRKEIPGITLRTSVMVGFPGETEKDFTELEKFIKDIKFERLGVFIYSREEDTKAFDFPNQIPEGEKHMRFDLIMEAQNRVSECYNKTFLGKVLRVLVDEKDPSAPDQYIGRTEHDAPEVDGNIFIKSEKVLKAGDFVDVKVTNFLEYDLAGDVV